MKEPKYAPDALKYQWRLYALIVRSDWATGLDKSVAFEIIDNYRKEFKNSRASLTYLQNATGADRKAVIASTRRIVEHGQISVIRAGAGIRPTEYKLHFELVQENASSGLDTTTAEPCTSSGLDTTTGGGLGTTTETASSGLGTTESVLPVPAYKADVQDKTMNDCAPATPPLADGLEATTAGSAQDGFEELWRAYGFRQKKAEAKAAYARLSPNGDLHVLMVEAADKWRARWAEQGNREAPRFTLAKWIEREEFECEPPTAYKPKERKAPTAVAPRQPASPAFRPTPRIVDLVAASLEETKNGKVLVLGFCERDRPLSWDHRIAIEDRDMDIQYAAGREFTSLLSALGLEGADDTSDLINRSLMIYREGGKLVYSPANDNHREAA